ncbi:hypothetical protein [Spirochaeta lutea]|uniref:O-antigen polymerase n=1 Tax=Spirochaeta lutea TaxID=1480694 RepID=A0A098QU53_9SPIO|nr:hypothetical protein [Spirochaeta lutea]KGE71131.1 hypothetical protein DC28_12845 [Spirochaeta lutea]
MNNISKKPDFLDQFYRLILFTIPFDNLFFAPSAGWATITPMLAAVWVILRLALGIRIERVVLLRQYAVLLGFIALVSIPVVFYPIQIGNYISSLFTIVLGFSVFLLFYFRYIIDGRSLEEDVETLIFAYTISIIYGVIKLFVHFLDINLFKSIFIFIEKRYTPRMGFTFTEPSFISMHVYGVLFIVYSALKNELAKTKVRWLMGTMVLLGTITFSSMRLLLDSVVFITIYLFITAFMPQKSLKKSILSTLVILLGVLGWFLLFEPVLEKIPRLANIVSAGIYSDGSLASRFFRINATVKGLFEDPLLFLFGSGLGNIYIPLREGWEGAYAEYDSLYLKEVMGLKTAPVDSIFSMPFRLIGEIGFFPVMIGGVYIAFKSVQQRVPLLVILTTFWLYIQFDSYTFYTFYIFLVLFICKPEINSNTKLQNRSDVL